MIRRTTTILVAAVILGALPVLAEVKVRVVHGSPDAPPIDVQAGNNQAFSSVTFKKVTDYVTLAPGDVTFEVYPARETRQLVTKPFISATATLSENTQYTLVALNKFAKIEPLLLIDDIKPEAGKARIRLVHASEDTPAVDVGIKDGSIVFKDIPFKKATEYVSVEPGTYTFEVRPTGSKNVLLNVPDLKLEAGGVYSVHALGLMIQPGTRAPEITAILSTDARPGEVQPDAPPAATVPAPDIQTPGGTTPAPATEPPTGITPAPETKPANPPPTP
ncbi:MAG: DUF4397 domain-containing protein [Gemmatimonadaceae bacterium]|nr:DUF4397 domain-containing protein [Gloeobacterales cyanobacterium ES-bin-141]